MSWNRFSKTEWLPATLCLITRSFIAWSSFAREKNAYPFWKVLYSSMNLRSLNILRPDLIYFTTLFADATLGFLVKLNSHRLSVFLGNFHLLFVVLAHKALEIVVEEVFAAGEGGVVVHFLSRDCIADENFGEASKPRDHGLKMFIVKDAVKGERLVRGRHALHVQHDDVLDQTENLVTTLVGLHDGHQVLHFVDN